MDDDDDWGLSEDEEGGGGGVLNLSLGVGDIQALLGDGHSSSESEGGMSVLSVGLGGAVVHSAPQLRLSMDDRFLFRLLARQHRELMRPWLAVRSAGKASKGGRRRGRRTPSPYAVRAGGPSPRRKPPASSSGSTPSFALKPTPVRATAPVSTSAPSPVEAAPSPPVGPRVRAPPVVRVGSTWVTAADFPRLHVLPTAPRPAPPPPIATVAAYHFSSDSSSEEEGEEAPPPPKRPPSPAVMAARAMAAVALGARSRGRKKAS